MNKFLCFFLFSSILNFGYSQTEEDFIQIIKVYYAKNNKTKACEESKKGLTKYPSSARITKLQALVCGNKIGSQISTETKQGPVQIPTQGPVQKPIQGSVQKPIQGPDQKPIQVPIQKPKKISIDLSEESQNKFSWNDKLNGISDIKLTIIITSNNLVHRKDVTGKSSYTFSSGNASWDGIPCTVELIISAPDGYVFSGNKKINVHCACKP